jgi:Co/Zn/Cd efflux system component
MKRILYLDTLRGFLILYVVFIHAFLLIIFQANYDYVDILPIWLLALFFPFLIIAMWGPMFSMMSATANTYLIHHQLEKGKPLTKTLFTRSSGYVLIILVHLINMTFFIHYIPIDGHIYRSLICGTLETGHLTIPSALMFVNSGTLLLIGLSGLFINFIFFFLLRKNQHRNLKRTGSVFIGLALLLLFIRPLIYPTIENIIQQLIQQGNIIAAIILSWLFRGQFGLIPMAAIPFFGVIFGLLLAAEKPKKTIIKIGGASTIGMFIISLIFLLWLGVPDLTLPYWPVTMVTFNLMLMILVTTILIIRFEFSTEKKRNILTKRTIFLRRFSMITLSMFVFESIIAVLWAKLFFMLFIDPFPYNIGADLLFLFCIITTWYIIARIWEKFDFKYSIEWFLIKINGKITGKSSQKLDVQSVLYHPYPPKEEKP